jgi:hypothetical protein
MSAGERNLEGFGQVRPRNSDVPASDHGILFRHCHLLKDPYP